MKTTIVHLIGGPGDGQRSVASGLTAIHQSEIYVAVEENSNQFMYLPDYIASIPRDELVAATIQVYDWNNRTVEQIRFPASEPIQIPSGVSLVKVNAILEGLKYHLPTLLQIIQNR